MDVAKADSGFLIPHRPLIRGKLFGSRTTHVGRAVIKVDSGKLSELRERAMVAARSVCFHRPDLVGGCRVAIAGDGCASTTSTYTATNSMGSDSGFTSGPGATLIYADGHMYYQQYQDNNGDNCPPWSYKTQVDHSAGDSFAGTIAPSANPYLGCNPQDPSGFVTVSGSQGGFDSDRTEAYTESAGVTFFGVSLRASTGFTSDIHHSYSNNTGHNQYLCGDAPMPDVPIIYSGQY